MVKKVCAMKRKNDDDDQKVRLIQRESTVY